MPQVLKQNSYDIEVRSTGCRNAFEYGVPPIPLTQIASQLTPTDLFPPSACTYFSCAYIPDQRKSACYLVLLSNGSRVPEPGPQVPCACVLHSYRLVPAVAQGSPSERGHAIPGKEHPSRWRRRTGRSRTIYDSQLRRSQHHVHKGVN